MARTFPPSIWLFTASFLAPLLAWALLKRAGHGNLGLSAGIAVAVAEAFVVQARRRSGD